VIGVNENDLVVLVNTVLVQPVRVQDPQVAAAPADTLFCDTPQTALELELVDTLTDGLSIGST